MEYLIAAVVVVFLCVILGAAFMFFYRQGIKDGQNIKEQKPLAKIFPSEKKNEQKDEPEPSTLAGWLGWNGDKQCQKK